MLAIVIVFYLAFVLFSAYLLSELAASNLMPDANGLIRNIPLMEYVQQILVGILLSDGTLVKKYRNVYFQMAQSIINLQYLVYVHSLMYAVG